MAATAPITPFSATEPTACAKRHSVADMLNLEQGFNPLTWDAERSTCIPPAASPAPKADPFAWSEAVWDQHHLPHDRVLRPRPSVWCPGLSGSRRVLHLRSDAIAGALAPRPERHPRQISPGVFPV